MVSDKFQSLITVASIFSSILMSSIHADDGLANISIREDSQVKTITISADALYLYTGETVDWAFTRTIDANSLQTTYKTFVFDWAPGFRIGLGYNMEHDGWDTQASYTCFQSKALGQTSGLVTPAFLASRLSLLNLLKSFATGQASLNLHYNLFNLDLGRSFLVSKHLLLRPFMGLKGGWINQALHSYWTIPDFIDSFLLTASENLEQKFACGGPQGGISGKWCFGNIRKHAFSLISQFEASYLWGHWSVQDRYSDNLNTIIYVKTKDRNYGSFMLKCFMGLGWDTQFDHNKSHCSLKLGYEIEDWLNQFQIFSDTSGSQNNDLILQGFNFGIRFDF